MAGGFACQGPIANLPEDTILPHTAADTFLACMDTQQRADRFLWSRLRIGALRLQLLTEPRPKGAESCREFFNKLLGITNSENTLEYLRCPGTRLTEGNNAATI